MTSTPLSNAPGWNEHLASASEASVKVGVESHLFNADKRNAHIGWQITFRYTRWTSGEDRWIRARTLLPRWSHGTYNCVLLSWWGFWTTWVCTREWRWATANSCEEGSWDNRSGGGNYLEIILVIDHVHAHCKVLACDPWQNSFTTDVVAERLAPWNSKSLFLCDWCP